MDFKSLSELAKYIDGKTLEVLKKDVAPKVVDLEQKHIQNDVYLAYTPKVYERTGELISNSSFQVEIIGNGISVTNETVQDGKYIPQVIETGVGYDFRGEFEKPRPFVANTRKEIISRGLFYKWLSEGLNKSGIRTEK